jgi:hypothetical protein
MASPAFTSNPEQISQADEVARFCKAHGLCDYLETAKRFARECLGSTRMTCELMQDVETDDQWIVLRADVHGSVESIVAATKNYTAKWVASVPWPERFMIRLLFNTV